MLLSLYLLALAQSSPVSLVNEANSFQHPDVRLQTMYRSALLNTANAQVELTEDGTAYVKTGDIPAEWLRDSSAQIRPYLFFAQEDPSVATLIKAVITRQAKSILVDPYANAFKKDYSVWEQKFEIDSLAYPILLAWTFWKTTGDLSFYTTEVQAGFERALATLELEQDHPKNSRYNHPELSRNPVGSTGMIWSGFRPSDDACQYHFLIPSEMQIVQALQALTELARATAQGSSVAERALKLARDVDTGIKKYGIIQHPKYGAVYAYEVDGLGHFNLMDDGNLPSLLSAPYFGYVTAGDAIYQNTRRLILSHDNPFYFEGKFARGIGSPHTPWGMVWPLALIAQNLTANSPSEKSETLEMLMTSDPGDHLLHEAFDPNQPTRFTREDFGWPNALFAEMILTSFRGRNALPVPLRFGNQAPNAIHNH